MPRSKKTRKVGLIGVRKDPDRKPRVTVPQGKKKGKGKPSGTRNAVEQQKARSGGKKTAQDPRHGSKRPIQLIKAEAVNMLRRLKSWQRWKLTTNWLRYWINWIRTSASAAQNSSM